MPIEPSNPSRRAELLAVSVIQQVIGSTGNVIFAGATDQPDFRIQYISGLSAIGEVKLDMDRARRAAWVALTDRESAQCTKLTLNSGTWSVSTKSDPNMRLIDRDLPKLVSEMIDQELDELSEYSWPLPPLFETMQTLGIRRINSIDRQGQDQAYIFPQGWAGMVPLDSNSAIPWIESFFEGGHRFNQSWNRLQDARDAEKHAFIWISDGSPEDLQMRISFHPENPPTSSPTLPSWLTHLWIGISGTFAANHYVWLFQPHVGWKSFEYE